MLPPQALGPLSAHLLLLLLVLLAQLLLGGCLLMPALLLLPRHGRLLLEQLVLQRVVLLTLLLQHLNELQPLVAPLLLLQRVVRQRVDDAGWEPAGLVVEVRVRGRSRRDLRTVDWRLYHCDVYNHDIVQKLRVLLC